MPIGDWPITYLFFFAPLFVLDCVPEQNLRFKATIIMDL